MTNALEIERAFKALQVEVLSRTKGGTSVEDVLQVMYETPEKIWWMSWDFIGLKTKQGKYLSHRAPARASDLALHESHLVEGRQIGRFSAYRLRTEHVNLVEARLGVAKEKRQTPKPLIENCEHGLPTYVQCPHCKQNKND